MNAIWWYFFQKRIFITYNCIYYIQVFVSNNRDLEEMENPSIWKFRCKIDILIKVPSHEHLSANTGVLFCQYWQQKVREASHDHRCFHTSIGIFATSSFYRLWLLKTHFWHFLIFSANTGFFSLICVHWLSKLLPFILSVSDQNKDCKQRCQNWWQRWRSLAFLVLLPILAEKTPVLAENARNMLVWRRL